MEQAPIAAGPLEASVRPVIAAYKDFCGVSDARFDTLTDAEMKGGAAFAGYEDYRAGWDAAIAILAAEVERLTWALDHGGKKYRRPAEIDKLMPTIQRMSA